MSEGDEPFLSRWSRRKLEAREEPAPAPAAPQAVPAAAGAGEAPAPLPPVESLTTESDFKPFMASDVAPETRQAALKKLFADARYNVPDPFEAYMGDFTKEDPIPLEMLKRLDHARSVLFEEPGPSAQSREAPRTEPPAAAEAPEPDVANGAARQDA